MRIECTPPTPRIGLIGLWDSFTGPGATGPEEWVQLIFGVPLSAVCFGLFIQVYGTGATWYQYAAVIILVLDISGGVVTNAANSAKRWFHRDGRGSRGHFLFVSAHLIHLAVVAWLFSAKPFFYFGLTGAYLLGAAALVLAVPLYLQRPTAFGLAAVGICLSSLPLVSIPGLTWFLPLLLLKLVLGHILKEAPFRPDIDEKA